MLRVHYALDNNTTLLLGKLNYYSPKCISFVIRLCIYLQELLRREIILFIVLIIWNDNTANDNITFSELYLLLYGTLQLCNR